MDLFDFNQIIELLNIEPGRGLLQCLLLFMIWIQSRGVRKELASLRGSFDLSSAQDGRRFEKIEYRLDRLETKSDFAMAGQPVHDRQQ